jgi:hypothetical protein
MEFDDDDNSDKTPRWDEYRRKSDGDGSGSYKSILSDRSKDPPKRTSTDFRYFRADIYSDEGRKQDLRIYSSIDNRIAPWAAYHPEDGWIVCFAAPLNSHLYDTECLIAFHNIAKMGNKIEKPSDFLKNWPKFPKDLGQNFIKHLIPYLITCAQYCMVNHCFMPSPHLMRPDHPNSVIFNNLHEPIQSKTLYETANLVHTALTAASTNLITYPGVEPALRDAAIYSQDGYGYLNNILSLTGHPVYNASAPDVLPPTQRNDQPFVDFLRDLVYFANMKVISGIFINERYFIYLLVNHAHRQTMGSWLEWLTNRIAILPMDKPLPTPFTMSQIYNTIANRARSRGYGRWLTTAPRELISSAALSVRSITENPFGLPSDDDTEGSPESPDNLHYMVCSLTSSPGGPGTCFACGSSDHKISALCPAIQAVSKNAFATKQVIKTLQDTLGKDAPKTQHVRAILDPSSLSDDSTSTAAESKA